MWAYILFGCADAPCRLQLPPAHTAHFCDAAGQTGCTADGKAKGYCDITTHNESVFVRHFFTIRGASARCSLSLLLLNESSSGGHKFKVRSLFIASGDGGAQRLWQRMDRPDMGT